MDAPSLSDLCSSCHAQEPRYRCPRCKTRTCSLACYKQHQQRASCSGKRDPATFVRRSQWATPTGVDQDYNYLRSIERHIDDTGLDFSRRGIAQPAKKNKVAHRAWVPNGPLDNYLHQHDITVLHAPMGMTREKTNLTRATKSGKVVWTVEWVDDSGVRRRQDDCLASNSVEELYRMFEVQMRNAERRRSESLRPAKRRKVACDVVRMENFRDLTGLKDSFAATTEQGAEEKSTEHGDGDAGPGEKGDPDTSAATTTDQQTIEPPRAAAKEAPPSSASPQQEATATHHFYLHLHSTSQTSNNKLPTLLPLSPTQTLTTALHSRTVQEYPTIYVLSHAPDDLPEYYTLEKDPAHRAADKLPKPPVAIDSGFKTRAMMMPPGGNEANGGDDEAVLSPSAILDLLRRDVATYMENKKGAN